MTSTLAPAYAWTMMAIVLGTCLLRALCLHSRLDVRMTTALTFLGLVAVMRDAHVQSVLSAHLVDPSVIRQVTHMFAMLASAAMFGSLSLWAAPAERRTSRLAAKWPQFGSQSVIYTVVSIMGLALFPLSAPARAAGQSLEEHGGWVVVAYMIVYAAPTIMAVTFGVLLVLQVARETDRRGLRIVMILVLFAYFGSLVDSITRVINSFFLVDHHQNWFTEWRTESNDALFLPQVTIIALVLAVPLVNRLAAALNLDASSRRVALLTPMWADLTAVMPRYVYHPRPTDPDDLADRLAVEIWDVLLRLPIPLHPTYIQGLSKVRERDRGPVIAALAVQEALDIHASEGTRPTESVSHEDLDITDLARGWAQARALRAEMSPATNTEGQGQRELSTLHA